MNSTFKFYRTLANCYQGTSVTATELALEARSKQTKCWKTLKRNVKVIPGNERRTTVVDGKEVIEELKDIGNYDDTIVAKLMLIFEKYIRGTVYKEHSFEPEDIIFQAELSLRYALELYQPEVVTKRFKVDKDGNKIPYETKMQVKFEEFWRRIFQSKIEGMYQDTNRNCRKVDYSSVSLEGLEEAENGFQLADPTNHFQKINDNEPTIEKLLEHYKQQKDYMSFLIVKDISDVVVGKGRDIMCLGEYEKPPEGYRERKFSKSLVIAQYRNAAFKKFVDLFTEKTKLTIKGTPMKDLLKNPVYCSLKAVYDTQTSDERLENKYNVSCNKIKNDLQLMHFDIHGRVPGKDCIITQGREMCWPL